jgi:hypothetical protein
MIVTKEFLLQHMAVASKDVWTKEQTDALGLSHPPVREEFNSIIGKEITDKQMYSFINGKYSNIIFQTKDN